MSPERIGKRIAAMAAELADLIAEPFDSLSTEERLILAAQWETFVRSQAVVGHRLVAGLDSAPLAELGEGSVANALAIALRISKNEANRRVREARDLAPRHTVTGEVLDPRLPHTSAAQARGQISGEHVRIIRSFFDHLPSFVTFDEREAAEAQLAEIACGLTPEELRAAAQRLAILLDQDGDLTDADRARRRYLVLGRQQSDGMSELRGRLDPQGRATLEAVLAKLAAPGMCNPGDDSPCVDGEPSADAVASDARSTGQRNHDALTAMGRSLLASGSLGSHKGLPVTLVISTTLQDLESGKGHAVTGGGSLLPISEVIRQASSAHPYLAVFDKCTEEPLFLGRGKRRASKAQRIMLYAKDRGCTRPGCTAPAYHSEAHHAVADWADGGQTNIADLTLACGPDNRRVKRGGWTTRKRNDGRTEWIPPPQLDTARLGSTITTTRSATSSPTSLIGSTTADLCLMPRQATDLARHRDLRCMAMKPCERVGLDFIAHAPFRFVSTVDLAITPEQLFEVLDDAESWPHWATAITKVTWTSPQPHGIGTTRTVYMRGGTVGDEEFLAWEPYSHMAFRFNEASSGTIAAFAEDYRVVQTPGGCHLTWVMAMKPKGAAGRIGMSIGKPVMARTFQKFLYNLRDYSDKRFATA